ncbi:MAG: hypothetical protein ACOX87_01585 [Chloroflexota bacterium]|jgi:hypothetical protein
MTLNEILLAYRSLRQQAITALRAKSTRELIAMRKRYESTHRYLYLHPALWTISSRRPQKKRMLEIPLPAANDQHPIRTMARGIDKQLSQWLKTAGMQLPARDRKLLDQIASAQPPIEREIARSVETRASPLSVATR